MRSHVTLAVFKRNVSSYFSGMLGYLFIVVFVVAGAFLAFDSEFFANNLCNLDQLSEQFPLLLLFIVPAITMTAWSDEKKLGTDELLFTLPAGDFEILLGKYLAVLAVYTIALIFSLTHVIVLSWLGQPDYGLIATTYLGYWLAGGALLAAGMFASVLTSSATVAFVLGAVICSIPVFIDQIPGVQGLLKDTLGITEPLSVAGHLEGFTAGNITIAGLLYFLGLTAFFLYLNLVMITRRHWAGGQDSGAKSLQFVVRVACLGLGLLCWTYTFAVAGWDIDATTEQLHTLSETTHETIDEIPKDKPVTIQAFISPDVPQEYVSVRKELIDRLREYDRDGGSSIEVRFVDVEPYSPEAEEADNLGIEPRQVQTEEDGRVSLADVYLGVIMTSGFDTVTIPFFDRGTPIEYELTRSVGTVSVEERRTVGVLTTDAKPMGGFNQQSFRSDPEWQIVQELKKQYDIKEISPDSPIEADVDVLIAILPSSLTQPQMDNFVAYVKAGHPTLIFDDPVPRFFPPGLQGAPLEQKPSPGGGMFGRQQPSEPKADGGRATSLTSLLKIRWDVAQSLFDMQNPHPKYAEVFPHELIFHTEEALRQNQPITSGLQELISFYPGVIREISNDDYEFTGLLKSRKESTGLNNWDDITAPGMFGGRQLRSPAPHYYTDDQEHILAALIEAEKTDELPEGLKAIFVADIDLVHDVMFDVWQRQMYDLKIDNVLFVLNCVDYLAGDERFIELRKRRPEHRTLLTLERQKSVFEQRRSDAVREAEEEAEENIEQAKERLNEKLEEIQNDMKSGKVDAGAMQVRLQNATEAENRKLVQTEKEIERKKNEQVRRVRIETEQEIRRIENGVWRWAILVPPLPAIILGITVLLSRLAGERQGIASDRMR